MKINPKKPLLKKPKEEIKDFVREAKRQIGAKAPLSAEELLGNTAQVTPKQLKQIRAQEEKKLREVRQTKAEILAQWRRRKQRMDQEQMAIIEQRKREEEEKKRQEELLAEEKEKKKKTSTSGEEAIAATGSSQKRPTGLWGVGRKFKKMFKWSTAERKGRSPR